MSVHVKAQVSLRFNCGCGFKCSKTEEAAEHTAKTKHTMHVLGDVKVA